MRSLLRSSFFRLLLMTLLAMQALTSTGWATASRTAPTSCDGWPFCLQGDPQAWLQLLHRFFAGTAGLLLFFILRKAWKEERNHLLVLPLPTLCTMMLFGQVFVGALDAVSSEQHLQVRVTRTCHMATMPTSARKNDLPIRAERSLFNRQQNCEAWKIKIQGDGRAMKSW